MEENQIFDPQEELSRRQFHNLFASKYLHTSVPRDAIHQYPWNSTILYEILHSLHEDNVLVPSDIEAILQVGGYYDKNHELWFTYNDSVPVTEDILSALSAYISSKAYVTLSMRLITGNKVSNSVTRFYMKVCNPTKEIPRKIAQKEVYELYCSWCEKVGYVPLHKVHFRKDLIALGVPYGKGYVSGTSGISYYVLSVDLSQEAWDARIEKEEARRYNVLTPAQKQQLWNEFGREDEVIETNVENSEEAIPSGTEENALIRIDSGIDSSYETDVQSVFLPPKEYRNTGESAGAIESEPSDSDGGECSQDVAADTEGTTTNSTTFAGNIATQPKVDTPKERLKKYPSEIRRFCKLMKATYLVNPKRFTQEDFEDYYFSADLQPLTEEEMLALYKLFVEYAQG